jgi:two-component system sensor histidine kinase ChvG
MKLGTRLIIFSSIFLVLLPWFGFHFIEKIEQSLLQGQEEAQSMAASAISTVLNGYTSLFDVDENALYVYPLEQNITIDGYDEDWYQLKKQFDSYADDSFSLLLSDNTQYLYAYLKVKDNNIVYRNPRYIPLDSSDHVRLEYLDVNNRQRRLILLTEGQGNISVYEVKKDWQTWKNGQHVNAVYGVWRETASGYDLELRLPVKWLEPNHRLSFSIVNVFGENERNPDTIVSTHTLAPEVLEEGLLNPLLFQSHEISSVIKNLSESDSRICVIDKYRRVRAVTGGQRMQASLCQAIDKVSEILVSKVLATDNLSSDHVKGQVTRIEEGDETLIVAAHPVFNGDEIIGAVLVSKNSRQILSLQRDTLKDIVLATLVLFVLVFISLLLFSSWLTYRINRLKNKTSSLVDESGRLIGHIALPDNKHHDEIGELSRSFSSLLDKLNTYTRFLESVPRMLRHEILNPVNTISMSLQSMQQQHKNLPGIAADIEAASNAVKQLQLIVSSLTEAANIDEALSQEEVEIDCFDIAALLCEYVHNSQRKHPDAQLRYQGIEKGVFVQGNDIRIVQLLDKIKDNALDFSLPNTDILFQLESNQQDQVIIRIVNEGEPISQQQLQLLFHGMVSHRSSKTDIPHLGIGLYVAHQIAEFHHGQLQIANRRDKQGVEVILILPVVKNT